MRIAQVAPLYESVPPKAYGGTERVVSYLTEELVACGHDVTLFASGDSVTRARLVPCSRRSLRLDEQCIDPLAQHMAMLEAVLERADEFDVVHFHVDYVHLSAIRRTRVAHLSTLHGRLDIPDLVPLYRRFRDAPLVSISDSQRAPLPFVNWVGTVHHGLPPDLYRPGPGGDYLAFLGRMSPEKGIERAIEIARGAGLPLRIAAKVDKNEALYFRTVVEPLLGGDGIEFVGEIGDAAKQEFLGNARAALFPIDWPEPFGIVMVEAMACGTPVIAFRRGSVPEVVEDGVSGFVVDDVDAAIRAIGSIDPEIRRRCRSAFDARFTADRMARDYLAIFAKVAGAAVMR
jgi:glycosyltransferase involved in cell wall biosynthesis